MIQKTLNKTPEAKKQEKSTIQNESYAPRHELSPDVDLYLDNNSYVLEFALPGVDEKSIDVSVEKNILTVKGVTQSSLPEGYELYYSENASGDYKRSFRFDEQISIDEISASHKNGLLRVTLPLKAPVSRKIEVGS